MSNSYGQESVSISKPCLLCGLPMAKTGKSYHPDCKLAINAVRRKMQRRHQKGRDTEAEWHWAETQAHIEWLLNQPHGKVKCVIGEQGENALLAFRIYLRRTA